MRSFPGAVMSSVRRRRWKSLLVSLILVGGIVAVPLANADDLRHQQSQVRKDIKHAESDLDESSAALRQATARLLAAKDDLSDARAHLHAVHAKLVHARKVDAQMAAKLKAAQARLTEAQQALVEGRRAVADQRDVVSNTVSDMYEQGDPQLRAFASLLAAQTTADLTRREEVNRTIVDNEDQVYGDLVEAEQQLAEREAQVQDATDAVAQQREEAADNLALMKKLTLEARSAKESVLQLVGERAKARQQAMSARKHELGVLAALHRREDRIRRQIIAEQRRRGGGISVASNGFLLPPVTGPITSPYGYRIHPIYGYWGLHDGTDFGVSCGEGMRASGDGVVTQKYWSDVYGNRLYVSLGTVNGKNLTVVYNHASSYRVGVGDHVRRGEIVGYVGDTGWSTGCHLHFTVLVNGTAVDPEKWL